MSKRPQAATIRAVVEHLSELGLSVYGYAADLKAGVYHEGGSLMDYDTDVILALRKWEDKGGMAEPEQP